MNTNPEESSQRSEERVFLESILENIPNIIFVKEAKDLRFVRFNKAAEEVFGYTRGEMIGKNDYDFFTKEEADFFTSKDRTVLANGRVLDIPEEVIHTKYKGVRTLHTKKIPVLGKDGSPQYLLGISEDVTGHKDAERFQALTKVVDDVIYDWDMETNLIWWSNTLETAFGRKPEEYKHVALWSEDIHPEDRRQVEASMTSAFEPHGAEHWTASYRFRKADGAYLSVKDHGYVIRDSHGKAVRMIGAMRILEGK